MKKIIEELVKLGWKIDEECPEELFYKDFGPGENGLPPSKLGVVELSDGLLECTYGVGEVLSVTTEQWKNNPVETAKKIEDSFVEFLK